jgi:hypothetical protein
VFVELGDRDGHYIKAVISVQRQIIVVGRLLLLASRSRTAWVLGTGCLATGVSVANAKVLQHRALRLAARCNSTSYL